MIYTTKEKQQNSNTIKIGRTVLVCLFWLAAWQISAVIVDSPLLFPTVTDTFDALFGLLKTKSFYMDVGWTLLRCLLSVALSLSFGIAFAVLAYKSSAFRSLMTLPVSFLKAVPVMAIVIYLILLIKANWVAVAACFLMCFPVVYTNVLSGFDAVSGQLLEVASLYRWKAKDVVKFIYVPSIMGELKAALKIIAGLSWKAVVAAEVLSVPKFSLGQGMITAKYYLETPTLFAYIFAIVTLSLLLEKLVCTAADKLTTYQYEGSRLAKNLKKDSKEKTCEKLNAPKIEIKALCKSFDNKKVLHNLNMTFDAGGRFALVGASGSGKTTLARIIAGLENADSGSVLFGETARIAYLFQEDRLLPWLNVYDNLASAMIGENSSPNDDAIREIAKSLELEDSLWKMPKELSGGMSHRVALGRAFLTEGNLLIMDEPFRGLDSELKERIVDRLWEKAAQGKTAIVISHSSKDIELLGVETVDLC